MNILSTMMAQLPTTPKEAMEWVDVARNGGGWFVAGVLCFVVVIQWKTGRQDMKEKDDKIVSILEKQNEAIKNTIGALKGGG